MTIWTGSVRYNSVSAAALKYVILSESDLTDVVQTNMLDVEKIIHASKFCGMIWK